MTFSIEVLNGKGFSPLQSNLHSDPINNLSAARKPLPSSHSAVLGKGTYGCRSSIMYKSQQMRCPGAIHPWWGLVTSSHHLPCGARPHPSCCSDSVVLLPCTPRCGGCSQGCSLHPTWCSGQLHLGQVGGLALRVAALLLWVQEVAQGALLRCMRWLQNALCTPRHQLGTLHLPGDTNEASQTCPITHPLSLAAWLMLRLITRMRVPSPKGNLYLSGVRVADKQLGMLVLSA